MGYFDEYELDCKLRIDRARYISIIGKTCMVIDRSGNIFLRAPEGLPVQIFFVVDSPCS